MIYYTVLWITILGGPLDGARTGIIYPTEAACLAATIIVSDTLSYAHGLVCEVTTLPSASNRPKRRP